jgi:dTDP-4-dehydrorhamnose reductase
MRVVLTGASGQLGAYVLGALLKAGHTVSAWSGGGRGERSGVGLRPVDLADARAVESALGECDPGLVIHAGAVSSAEAVRLDPARGRAVNVDGTATLAGWCARRGRKLIYTSTDLVFDGANAPYAEDAPAHPVLAYGQSKLDAEPAVLAAPGGLVARLSLMYGPSRSGRESYFDRTLAALRRGEPQAFFEDEFRTPLDLATAAEALVRLAQTDFSGRVHVGGVERLSRHDLIRRVGEALGIDPGLVLANRQRDVTFPEPRPADVSLDTSRLAELLPDLRRPTVEEAVAAMRV